MFPRKVLKNRVSLTPFSAFLLDMEQVTNKKDIKNISETKPEQEDCPTQATLK